jgi:hypothetical protein
MKSKMYLVQPHVKEAQRDNPTLLRIILSDQYTRIDFGYAAPWIYAKGGWIHIAPYSYISIKGSNEKYGLINAQNIPISPDRHEFETIEDWKVFSLFFEALPLKDCVIDIIEEETPSPNDFNYYGITLENVRQLVIES